MPDNQDPEYQEYLEYLEYLKSQPPIQETSADFSEADRKILVATLGKNKDYQPRPEEIQKYKEDQEFIFGMALGAPGRIAGVAKQAPGAVSRGFSKLADWMQQTAMRGRKFEPGVGTEAIKAGVKGTQGQMERQLEKAIAERGSELGGIVSRIPGKIPQRPVAGVIAKESLALRTPLGRTPPELAPLREKAGQRALEIAQRSDMPPEEALAYKRLLQKVGYKKGEPLSKFESELAQKEALALGEQIKKAAKPIGKEQDVARLNEELSKLLKGQRGITRPETLPTQPGAPARYIFKSPPGARALTSYSARIPYYLSKAPESAAIKEGRPLLDLAAWLRPKDE